MHVKYLAKKALPALALIVLAAGVVLFGFAFAAYRHPGPGLPAWKLGRALGLLPLPLARAACAAAGDELLCLRGYYRARLQGPVVGNPAAPCRGLQGLPARACSEVMGLRLVEGGVSRPLVVCESLADPLACARYVGRAAFTRGGFEKGGDKSAARVCAQGRGEYLAHCRAGAAMEAVERVGEKILPAAEGFCLPYDRELCWSAIASALKAHYRKDPQKALEACTRLSPLGTAYCVRYVRGS